jgi:hypothetical protein
MIIAATDTVTATFTVARWLESIAAAEGTRSA